MTHNDLLDKCSLNPAQKLTKLIKVKSILILLIIIVIAGALSLTGGLGSFLQSGNLTNLANSSSIIGTSTGSNSPTTLNDTSQNFIPNSLIGGTVTINSGSGVGQTATIVANTNNQITVSPAWKTIPDNSSTYTITPPTGVVAPVGGQIILRPPPNQQNQLQLGTFTMITLTPTSAPATCLADNAKKGSCNCIASESNGVICDNGTPNTPSASYEWGTSTYTCPGGGMPCHTSFWDKTGYPASWGCDAPNSCVYLQSSWAASPNYSKYAAECSTKQLCFGKPVIYLYPTKKMLVNVSLSIPGKIIDSIPHYPKDGWTNILAYPSGLLVYRGDKYKELYYESKVDKKVIPQDGFVFSTQDLRTSLNTILRQKGLISAERIEFLNYWLPKLYALNEPFIYVGFLSQAQKEAVDKIQVTPKPDTVIAFLVYFKGLSSDINTVTPKLASKPKRKGFTLVEWGATIDY